MLDVFLRVDISMVVICYVSDIIVYDRRRAELSNEPLYMKQDTTSREMSCITPPKCRLTCSR